MHGGDPPNRDHGPPLEGDSCNPPVKTSFALQIGESMTGSFKLVVLPGAPGPPDDSDVKIDVSVTDVRCDDDGIGDTQMCFAPNASGGPDYLSGSILQGRTTLRITDHWNGPFGSSTGGPDTATVEDIPFSFNVPCFETEEDLSTGSFCFISTSANALVGGPAAKDGRRTGVEISQLEVFDGGFFGDGSESTERFLIQGYFIP